MCAWVIAVTEHTELIEMFSEGRARLIVPALDLFLKRL